MRRRPRAVREGGATDRVAWPCLPAPARLVLVWPLPVVFCFVFLSLLLFVMFVNFFSWYARRALSHPEAHFYASLCVVSLPSPRASAACAARLPALLDCQAALRGVSLPYHGLPARLQLVTFPPRVPRPTPARRGQPAAPTRHSRRGAQRVDSCHESSARGGCPARPAHAHPPRQPLATTRYGGTSAARSRPSRRTPPRLTFPGSAAG